MLTVHIHSNVCFTVISNIPAMRGLCSNNDRLHHYSDVRKGENPMRVYKIVQFFCYVCGIAFLIVTLTKRSTLQLSGVESFITLLLIVCGTLLFICVGTIGGVAGVLEQQRLSSRAGPVHTGRIVR
jgi:hypothetical protein